MQNYSSYNRLVLSIALDEPWQHVDMASRNQILTSWKWYCKSPRNGDDFLVGLFLCADCDGIAPFTGVKLGVIGMLNQAFTITRRMEIVFVGLDAVKTGRSKAVKLIPGKRHKVKSRSISGFEHGIPVDIINFAKRFRVSFKNFDRITHEEGRNLFIRVSLSFTEYQRAVELGIDPMMIAFQKERGNWTPREVESILRFSAHPTLLLNGALAEETALYGLTYEHERQVLTAAGLADIFVNTIAHELNTKFGEDIEGHNQIKTRWLAHNLLVLKTSIAISLQGVNNKTIALEAEEEIYICLLSCLHTEFRSAVPRAISNVCLHEYGKKQIFVVSRDFFECKKDDQANLEDLLERHSWQLFSVLYLAGFVSKQYLDKLVRSNSLSEGLNDQRED
jgi:hypothetical protein